MGKGNETARLPGANAAKWRERCRSAGGLLFIGATNYDKKFHAFDKATGKLLWETTLPFAGNATPITYQVKGRQYVVIAAGGGKDLKSKSGGIYVAFAVPKK